MRDGELDRIDAAEIGVIHHVLAPRAPLGLLAQQCFQRVGYRIERGHAAQTERAAPLFQPLADFGADHGEHHQARIVADFPHDPVKMLLRSDHRPEMAHDIGIVELRECRLGDHFQRFTGGIRQEMKMEPLHEPCAIPVDRARAGGWTKLWIDHG